MILKNNINKKLKYSVPTLDAYLLFTFIYCNKYITFKHLKPTILQTRTLQLSILKSKNTLKIYSLYNFKKIGSSVNKKKIIYVYCI